MTWEPGYRAHAPQEVHFVAGKKHKEAFAKVDRLKLYQPQEALELLKSLSFTKFDETVELHIRSSARR
jgi:ribosomal protein L1